MATINRDYFEQHRDAILAVLREADARSYRYTGCQYSAYLDTDGDTGIEESPAGDQSYRIFSGDYDRFYIHTFCHQYYDALWEYRFDGLGVALDAFRNRFGYGYDESDENTDEDAMREAAAAHGDEAALDAWLAEERDAAIEDLCDEQDYDEILDAYLEELDAEQ